MSESGVFNIDAAIFRVEAAVSGHAGGADTVKSVATILGSNKKVNWFLAHAEEMTGFIIWQDNVNSLEHFSHAVGRKDAADAEAVDGLTRTILG